MDGIISIIKGVVISIIFTLLIIGAKAFGKCILLSDDTGKWKNQKVLY